jgi:hypothetical protein
LITQQELEIWLQEGIGAAKAGQHDRARLRLLDVVEQDQTNEAAWFWLYYVFERREDRRVCLENLMAINPRNSWAARELQTFLNPAELAHYKNKQVQPKPAAAGTTLLTPVLARKLVTAFWAGISIIFLGGGIIAASSWLVANLRNNTFASYITVAELFEFFVALIFIMVGVITLNVAIGTYLKSPVGFYGSILLAFALLFIGPTFSLIATQTPYITLVCTGGIPGMIILLTLASPPESKHTQRKK